MAEMIASLKALGQLERTATPKVAAALERTAKAQISRGTDPDGKPWPLTQEGEVPLRGAAGALAVVPAGRAVIMTLRGPEARHNNRTARGGVKRQVLPEKGVPRTYQKAIKGALDVVFRDLTGQAGADGGEGG